MPIYEYKCDLCNGMWEEIQKFSDDPLTICKSCEKEGGVHKLVSGGIAFHLKGGGWAGDGYDKSGKGDHDGVYHWDADKGEVKNTLPEHMRHDQNETPYHIPLKNTKTAPDGNADNPGTRPWVTQDGDVKQHVGTIRREIPNRVYKGKDEQ